MRQTSFIDALLYVLTGVASCLATLAIFAGVPWIAVPMVIVAFLAAGSAD